MRRARTCPRTAIVFAWVFLAAAWSVALLWGGRHTWNTCHHWRGRRASPEEWGRPRPPHASLENGPQSCDIHFAGVLRPRDEEGEIGEHSKECQRCASSPALSSGDLRMRSTERPA